MDQSPNSWPPEVQALYEGYAQLNPTELYQCCRKAGLCVQPHQPREYYLGVLTFMLPEAAEEHIIDGIRNGLIAFIDEYWQQLQAQLKCPAKNMRHPDPAKKDARPCYKCMDMQVVACVANLSPQNRQRLQQLQLATPYVAITPKENSMMAGTVDIKEVPRELHALMALPLSHQYRLMYLTGKVNTQEQKLAFNAMPKEQRAAAVHEALIEYDKKKEAEPMAPSHPQAQNQQQTPGLQQAPAPMGQPMMMGQQQPQMAQTGQHMVSQQMPTMPMMQPTGGIPGMGTSSPQMGPPMGGGFPGMQGAPMGSPPPMQGAPSMGMQGAPLVPTQWQPGIQQMPQPQPTAPTGGADIATLMAQVKTLATAMDAMRKAQEGVDEYVKDIHARVIGNARIDNLSLMAIVLFVQQQNGCDLPTALNWYKQQIKANAHVQVANELLQAFPAESAGK